MFVDYHVHLDKLEWSLKSIEDICKRAGDTGVDKVGVVVHTKILDGFQPLYNHILSKDINHKKLKFNKNIEEYINLLCNAKLKGYPVDIGIEVCYSPEGQNFLNEKLLQYPFDYTIGSVHLIGEKHYKTAIEHYRNRELVGRMYYELVLKAIESKLFNIIGHIEIARREGVPGLHHYPGLFDDICRALVKNNCAVEINTKWLTKHENLVPDSDTLRYMAEKGVKFVFGSDAHHPERVGYAKEEASSVIHDAGFRNFSTVKVTE